MKKIKNNDIKKEQKLFYKKYPEIKKAMEVFDISYNQYQQSLQPENEYYYSDVKSNP